MTISGTAGAQQTYQNTPVGRVGTTGQDITGQGLTGQSGDVPNAIDDPAYGALMASIAVMIPEITGEVLELALVEITAEMKKIEEASQKDQINIDSEKKRQALEEKKAKIEEALKKIEDAIEKEKHASIWDKIKMAFQALGALIAIAVGIALTALGVPVGPLLIGIGVVALVMVIDSVVKTETGKGIGAHIVGGFAELFGHPMSDEDLAKVDMGFSIAMAVVGLIMAVAAFFVPGGQASAAATLAQSVSTIATAALQIGTAVGDVTAGVMKFEATNLQADAKKLQADALKKEAFIALIDEYIDQALSRLMNASQRFDALLDSIVDAIVDRAESLAKAKFG